jgi:hypothetical protein
MTDHSKATNTSIANNFDQPAVPTKSITSELGEQELDKVSGGHPELKQSNNVSAANRAAFNQKIENVMQQLLSQIW